MCPHLQEERFVLSGHWHIKNQETKIAGFLSTKVKDLEIGNLSLIFIPLNSIEVMVMNLLHAGFIKLCQKASLFFSHCWMIAHVCWGNHDTELTLLKKTLPATYSVILK